MRGRSGGVYASRSTRAQWASPSSRRMPRTSPTRLWQSALPTKPFDVALDPRIALGSFDSLANSHGLGAPMGARLARDLELHRLLISIATVGSTSSPRPPTRTGSPCSSSDREELSRQSAPWPRALIRGPWRLSTSMATSGSISSLPMRRPIMSVCFEPTERKAMERLQQGRARMRIALTQKSPIEKWNAPKSSQGRLSRFTP